MKENFVFPATMEICILRDVHNLKQLVLSFFSWKKVRCRFKLFKAVKHLPYD